MDEAGWQAVLEAIARDQQRFLDHLHDPAIDLFAPLPYGDGQNVLREALLIGESIRLLGAWG